LVVTRGCSSGNDRVRDVDIPWCTAMIG